MGCGSYSYSSALTRSAVNKTKNREQVFKSRQLFPEMDIKGKIRECCETAEHPNTLPIIIALDVTGSMGYIPEILIKEQLPEIVKSIKEAGIEHPEICFCAVGDDIYDSAPIQVGQFESSDELIEKWLVHSWLEGGGGGNEQEAYALAHYFAAYHTKCDAFKRGQKGILITIGDEKCNTEMSKHNIEALFGDRLEVNVKVDALMEECSKNWNIFHINVDDTTSLRLKAEAQWNEILGKDHVKTIPKTDKMLDLIPAIVSCITSLSSNTTSVTTSSETAGTITML